MNRCFVVFYLIPFDWLILVLCRKPKYETIWSDIKSIRETLMTDEIEENKVLKRRFDNWILIVLNRDDFWWCQTYCIQCQCYQMHWQIVCMLKALHSIVIRLNALTKLSKILSVITAFDTDIIKCIVCVKSDTDELFDG